MEGVATGSVIDSVGGKRIEGVEVEEDAEGITVSARGRETTSPWVSWPSVAASPPPDTNRNIEAPIQKCKAAVAILLAISLTTSSPSKALPPSPPPLAPTAAPTLFSPPNEGVQGCGGYIGRVLDPWSCC